MSIMTQPFSGLSQILKMALQLVRPRIFSQIDDPARLKGLNFILKIMVNSHNIIIIFEKIDEFFYL